MRVYDKLKYLLERFLIRGAAYQLLTVAALIGLISLGAGALLWSGVEEGKGLADSVWWAFLRLTDPGYLGDDEGTFKRVISTVVTVLGYVLFMGSLVAILTQWLNSTMRSLESGLTPVVRKDHVLVLGWTERVGTVMRDLFLSEGRVRRFLQLRGARRLHVVVLSDDSGPAMLSELRSRVGAIWRSSQVTLRSGSPLRSDHLSRVDFSKAATVLLPAGDFHKEGAEAVDTHTIKTLLSMSNHPHVQDPSRLPLAVAEMLDARKAEIAYAAYAGPLEVLAADAVVSRLLAQNIRQPGLSHVYTELLTQREGNELFARDFPKLHGSTISALAERFDRAVPLGVVRLQAGRRTAHLNPSDDITYAPGDRLVLMARSYEEAVPRTAMRADESSGDASEPPAAAPETKLRRVLVLGWNHRVPPLLFELSRTRDRRYVVDLASAVPATEREAAITRATPHLEGIELRHLEVDYTIPAEVAQLDLSSYRHILLAGSDWVASREQSDARTLVGYLTLHRAMRALTKRPHIVVELLDPSNVGLLGERPGEVLISPVILSHMLTQVALRRELNAVFDELFSLGGTEITFRDPADYGYESTPHTFAELQREASRRGDLALGVFVRNEGGRPSLQLNPARDTPWTLGPDDELVVLTERPVRIRD